MEIYEVFRRSGHKDPFEHCGTVKAADPDMALYMAKECFLRRGEGQHLWVVRRRNVHVHDQGSDNTSVADKSYRHPHGYRDVVEKRKRALQRAKELAGS